MIRITDAARRTPMAILKTRWARSERSQRCKTAPKASQGRQLGTAATTNVRAKATDCPRALPARWSRKVAAALVHTSHDFGLTHWKAAAPKKPIGLAPVVALAPWAVAIFQASHNR